MASKKKKKKTLVIALAVILLLLAMLVLPLPPAVCADGGSKSYYPISQIYSVMDYNRWSFDPGYTNPHTIRGKVITLFGKEIYDGRYRIEGFVYRGQTAATVEHE